MQASEKPADKSDEAQVLVPLGSVKPAKAEPVIVSTEPYIKYLLLGAWVSMTVAYYFAFFFIRDLEGGLFVNAVILGSAEVFANFASGFLMLILHEDAAYKVCSAMALVFNLLLPYVENPYLHFLCLFLAIGGLGGMDNTIYLVIEMQVCPTDIGGTM